MKKRLRGKGANLAGMTNNEVRPVLPKDGPPRDPEPDPVLKFLWDSIKLTLVLYAVVISMWSVKWLIEYTGNTEILGPVEKIFEIIKSWSFALLLVERFLELLALLIPKIDEHIAKIAQVIIERAKKIIKGLLGGAKRGILKNEKGGASRKKKAGKLKKNNGQN